MSARLVAVGIAVLALYACGQDRQPTAPTAAPTPPVATTPTPSPTPPPVQGTVVDFQTARPISGAVVGFALDFLSGPIGLTQTTVTDANGAYSLPEPPIRSGSGLSAAYHFVVNNQSVGRGHLRGVNRRAGDVAVHTGPCVTRYGLVIDSTTSRPVVGASVVSLSNRVLATTDKDGWYQYDWGCVGPIGFNTTWLIMTHPSYNSSNFASGRGQSLVRREDVILRPR